MNISRLTVFTPTYNRGYIIKNCYESLCSQTNKDFIWLIVDDGSTDNTEELVETWIKENKIKITYIKQKNGGKHVAHNTGVLSCETEFFVCVDSDDYFTADAVEVIHDNLNKLASNHSLAGMIALTGQRDGNVIGTRMPQGIFKSRMIDLYLKYGFKGDTIIILKADILKSNLFPVFDDEKFVTEAVVYDKIDQGFEFLLIDKVLYVCEYLEDGYSRNLLKIHQGSPKGYIYFLTERIRCAETIQDRYMAVAYYLAGCWSVNYKNPIKYSDHKTLCVLAIPKSIIIFLKPEIKKVLIDFRSYNTKKT